MTGQHLDLAPSSHEAVGRPQTGWDMGSGGGGRKGKNSRVAGGECSSRGEMIAEGGIVGGKYESVVLVLCSYLLCGARARSRWISVSGRVGGLAARTRAHLSTKGTI